MDAVAADRDLAAGRFGILETDRHAVIVLIDPEAAMPELHGICAQTIAHGAQQYVVQVGAMDRKLRPVVAGVTAARLLVDELAVPAVEGEFARLDAARGQRVLQAEF